MVPMQNVRLDLKATGNSHANDDSHKVCGSHSAFMQIRVACPKHYLTLTLTLTTTARARFARSSAVAYLN